MIVGAARGLAVDGDELVAVGPHRRDPILEAAPEQNRIDPVDQAAQPALARNAVMVRREPPQEVEVILAPGDDVVEIVARSDRPARHQQQDFLERVHHPPGLAAVFKRGKMLQKQTKPRPRHLLIRDRNGNRDHDRAPYRIRALRESSTRRQCKISQKRPLT